MSFKDYGFAKTDTNRMKAEFELNTDDVIAYSRHIKTHHPIIKKFFFGLKYGPLLIGVIFLSLAFGSDLDESSTKVRVFTYIAILSFIVGLLNRYIISRWTAGDELKYQNSLPQSFKEHTITLSPEGLSDDFGSKNRSVLWNEVEYIGMDDFGVYITSKRTAPEAKAFGGYGRTLRSDPQATSPYIIPRRAFSSDSKFKNFFETAKSWHQTYLKN